MNDEQGKQLLRELKIIRICAIIIATVLTLFFLFNMK